MLLKTLQLGVATLIACACACARAESPTVVLGDIGTVVGTTNATLGFDSFMGIPYVQPPVGPLRWQTPVPLTRDSSRVINATAWGPACIQVPFGIGGPQLVRLRLMCALLR
jgi:acetylcholinesterase